MGAKPIAVTCAEDSFSSSQQPPAKVVNLGRLLSHVHLGPTSLEENFIHQSFHQVDAATMRGFKLFGGGWVRELSAVKTFSFVPDHNGDFLIGHTPAVDVNVLMGVFMIAVNDCIRQGFSQGHFNVDFASRHTSAFLDEKHQLVYER